MALTLVTEYRILLSGTPLQNNIGELFNLLEYLDPVKFCSQTREHFQKAFAESVMMKDQSKIFTLKDAEAQLKAQPAAVEKVLNPEEGVVEIAPDAVAGVNVEKEIFTLDTLQGILQPHILRRFKRDVFKTFPKKKEVILRVEMTYKQKQVAKCLIEKNFDALSQFEQKNNTGVKVSLKHADNILMMLRMISNHPLHLTELYGTEIFRMRNAQRGGASKELLESLQNQLNTVQDFIRDSGKLQYLDKMMDLMFPKGHRILLFTQFRGSLDILQDYLTVKGVKHLRLDGETENMRRQKLIDLYNAPDSPYKIFLLSTKAGGLGINLTTADTIVIFDSDFNPHNDVQALNRAHRIGQKNNVMVYRLICKNSVEERIIEAAKHKLMLDTMMTHSAVKQKDNKEESNALYQILKFGTKKLFDEDVSAAQDKNKSTEYTIDEEQLAEHLDREKQFKELEEQEQKLSEKDQGVKDYLSGFKVATIDRKEVKQTARLEGDGVVGEEMISSDEEHDNDNQVFQRLLKELKDKEKANQPVQVDVNFGGGPVKGIATRNQLKCGYQKPNIVKKNTENVIVIPLSKEADQPAIQPTVPLQQTTRCYEMTPEYANFIGQFHSGEVNIYHDGNLYLAQMLGQMSSVINKQEKKCPLSYHNGNEHRISIIGQMKQSKRFNQDFVQTLLMNEDPNFQNQLPFIKVWGFNMLNVKDFFEGFFQFGIDKQCYGRFYRKVQKRIKRGGSFNSLNLVSEQQFKDFCKYVFDFWHFIISELPMFSEVPQFIFSLHTAQEIANRNYEIFLIKSFIKTVELQNESGGIAFIEAQSNCTQSWSLDFDNYVLAKLILSYGFESYHLILRDPLWTILNPQSVKQANIDANLGLRQAFRALRNKDTIERLNSQICEIEMRYSRIVLYQKISKQSIEILKDAVLNSDQQLNVLDMNEQLEAYCLKGIQFFTTELVTKLKETHINSYSQ